MTRLYTSPEHDRDPKDLSESDFLIAWVSAGVPVPEPFTGMLSRKRPGADISPHGTGIPNRSVSFHSLFFCLRSVQGQGHIRQKHWITWGKWDRISAGRKAQVYTSLQKLKHMPNFHFLRLKFPLLRRLANKQSHFITFIQMLHPHCFVLSGNKIKPVKIQYSWQIPETLFMWSKDTTRAERTCAFSPTENFTVFIFAFIPI